MKNVNMKQLSLVLITILAFSSCKKADDKKDKPTDEAQNYSEEELYRPNFHFTPENNWMNDPNGMFYYNGYYHLYFQHHPDSNVWGPMHWGHAISKDMITWTEQPIALYPDELGTIFSGSAVLDFNNSSGFGKTPNDSPVVAIYTNSKKLDEGDNWKQTQSVAFSLDEGKTYTKYENNPVIDNTKLKDFRDPKVTWDEDGKQWVMSLAVGDKISFYSSENLKDWTYLSDFGQDLGGHGGVWECPDLFKLPVQSTDKEKWVLLVSINPGGPNGGSATQYYIGEFDGTKFIIDEEFKENLEKNHTYWIDFGRDNYAGVTWSNATRKDGSKLMIGWMSNWDYAQEVPTESWRSAMTIAREIKLKNDDNTYRLLSSPVKELDNYKGKKHKKENVNIDGDFNIISSDNINLASAKINFNISNLKDDRYTFKLSNPEGDVLLFGYDNKDETFFINRKNSGKTDFSEKFTNTFSKAQRTSSKDNLSGTILLDKTSIEIFYDNGETVMTEIFYPNAPYQSLSIASEHQEFKLDYIEINELKFN